MSHFLPKVRRTRRKFRPELQLTHIKCALVVVAHADDAEWGCGATVAKLTAQGCQVHFAIATDGSQGDDTGQHTPESLVLLRQEEQRKAASMLGVHDVHFFGFPDGHLTWSHELRGKVVRLIRTLHPDAVFTHDPSPFVRFDAGGINHSDHRACGQATIDAVYPAARVAHMHAEHLGEGMQPHQAPNLLLFDTLEPNHWEDADATAKVKIEALHCHASQFRWRMDEWFDEHMREMGKDVRIARAEAFRRFSIA